MARILIAYGTTHGQTAKIAAAMAGALTEAGFAVDVFTGAALSYRGLPDAYDAVIVAASVHVGGHQRSVRRWVRRHRASLNARPGAFVSVCLGVLQPDPEVQRDVRRNLDVFLARTGWQPRIRKPVAGALPYTRYNWLLRLVMRRIVRKAGGDTDTSRDYEYTDWEGVRAIARELGRLVVPATEAEGRAPVASPAGS
jgi:menaquinone-dependent protoporphyrinogen oxidase